MGFGRFYLGVNVVERRIKAKRSKNPDKLEEIDEELNCPRTSL
jgi:hypothetical protein